MRFGLGRDFQGDLVDPGWRNCWLEYRRFRYRCLSAFACFGGRNLDTVDPPPDDVGAHASLNNGLVRFGSALSLVVRLYHAIGNDLFFADMDLGFFLGG
jgi:hypothetical protein